MEPSMEHLQVVPAEPGWRFVYVAYDGTLTVAEAVVAWRIETKHVTLSSGGTELQSRAFGINGAGSAGGVAPDGSDPFGYLRPDGKVEQRNAERSGITTYDSLEAAHRAQFP